MSTHKYIDIICIIGTVVMLAVVFLLMTLRVPTDPAENVVTADHTVTDHDYSGAAKIVFSGNAAEISGNGAYFENGSLHIAAAGGYVLSGELENGSVIVSADKKSEIFIMLDGVNLSAETGAAIIVDQAKAVTLTLAENTENTVKGGIFDDGLKIDGAVYAKDDLIFCGAGSLTVTSEYGHGIVCNDDLVFAGGKISVKAGTDAVHANDSVKIYSTELELSAGDDGITVSNDNNTSLLFIESGRVNISSCYEGLEACTVRINGGDITVYPEDDGLNANNGAKLIEINGGSVTVINKTGRDADGFDSNGDIIINGGNVFISVSGTGGSNALDYGSENGGVCQINGGTVAAFGGSVMAEKVSENSAQGYIMKNTSVYPADTKVTLISSNGKELISVDVPADFSLLTLSVPEMKKGDLCTLKIGDESEEITVDCIYSGDGKQGIDGNFGGREGNDKRDFPSTENGEMPSGFRGEPPQIPEGEMPSGFGGEPPQMPEREMPSGFGGEPPQMSNGEVSFAENP